MFNVLTSHDGSVYDKVLENVSYVEALAFIKSNIRAYERKGLDLDIENVETGLLVSWVIR